jgi:5-methylcytosine-specific restriction endonuclease McrA
MPRRVGKKDPTQWVEENHDRRIPDYVQRRIIVDAGDLCRSCRGRVRPGSGHIDHIFPLQDGGAHAFGNLQYLCQLCHGAKTSKENSTRAKGNRVFAKTYGVTKSKGRGWGGKKPKSKSGAWEPFTCPHTGVLKARWVSPGDADDN